MYRLLVCYRLFKRYVFLKCKYRMFKVFDIHIGKYQDLYTKCERIATIDQDGMIHSESGYETCFHPDTLYKGGYYLARNKFELTVVLEDNRNMLIEKKFNGRVFEFYNELANLHRLRKFDFIPEIKYVSYKNNAIYTEFILGSTLREKLALSGARIRDIDMNGEFFSFDEKAERAKWFLGRVLQKKDVQKIRSIYNDINSKKIIIHDIKYGNILIGKEGYYLVDFETSIFFPELPPFLFRRLQRMDKEKIEKLFPVN